MRENAKISHTKHYFCFVCDTGFMYKSLRYECFVVEYNCDTGDVCIKSIVQYGRERAAEQRKEKAD